MTIRPNSGRLRGHVFMLSSSVLFSVMGTAVKMLPAEIGSAEKLFFRSAIGLGFLMLYIVSRWRHVGGPHDRKGLFLRGALGAVATLCFFYSIDRAGLIRATLYCYSYPLFATVIAWRFLGERPSRRALIALVVAFVGVLLTLWPSQSDAEHASLSGNLVGLLGGFLSGCAVVSVRRIAGRERSEWIVAVFLFASGLLASPSLRSIHFAAYTSHAWMLFMVVGVCALLAQLFMTAGYSYLSAVQGGVWGLTVPAMSGAIGWMVFNERLGLPALLGGCLILASAGAIVNVAKPSPPAA